MRAIEAASRSLRLARVLRNPSSTQINSGNRINSSELTVENASEFHSLPPCRRHSHWACWFSGNTYSSSSCDESKNRKDVIQNPSLLKVMPTRWFSSEAEATNNDSADVDTVKGICDKILNCVVEKRTAPPNAWLWSLIAKCSTHEDIELLFDVLQKLRTFRLSNLRISDDFNSALCREITKACVRAGAIDFGKKALWKNNLFGLTPDIGSAHHLLLRAKQHNDVNLMVELMKLVKKNDIPLQPGTADIVLSICFSAGRWDLMSKYGKRFVKSGVKLRQTSFDLWMELAAKKGDVESLWKVDKWRSDATNKHSLSTGFSCAKGYLLDNKPGSAAAMIGALYQTLPEAKRSNIVVELQKLVSQWPLVVVKQQSKENRQAFGLALQREISGMIDALKKSGVDANITIQDFTRAESVSA